MPRGVYKKSEEHKRKLSEAKLGKKTGPITEEAAKPKPSPRTAMERRLKKLELEAADLRERLRNLPGAD